MMSTRRSSGLDLQRLFVRYLSPRAALVVSAILGGLVILGLTAASAGVYDAVAEKDGISGLDRPTLDYLIAWRTPLANHLFTWFTNLGGPLRMTLIASVAMLLHFWWWRSLTPLLLMIIAVAGSLTLPMSERRSSDGRGHRPVTRCRHMSMRFPSRLAKR